MKIITEFPTWFVLICLLLAVAYAWLLYSKAKNNKYFSNKLKALLFALRFISVALLSFFLLKPLIENVEREVEKPIIVFAQDCSSSLLLSKDSTFLKEDYPSIVEQFKKEFNDDYELRLYGFGSKVKEDSIDFQYSENSTNFSELQQEIYNKYSNRNVGAVIIASDGLYNKGNNPTYTFKKIQAPIYTLALGDTSQKTDALIEDIRHNRLNYLNKSFPVEVILKSHGLKGETCKVQVFHKGRVKAENSIKFNKVDELQKVKFYLDAEEVGLHRYDVRISKFDSEVNHENNSSSFFIDVLDNRQKILFVASAPHPDIAAVRNAIQSFDNYELEVVMAKDFKASTEDYSLVIFHQLPHLKYGKFPIESFIDSKTPLLFILGKQDIYAPINRLQLGVQIEKQGGKYQDVLAEYNQDFKLFKIESECSSLFSDLPPLKLPQAEIKTGEGFQNVLTQKIGKISTDYPVLAYSEYNNKKIGFFFGEGIWRWRMEEFRRNNSHDCNNEIISKSIQLLASKKDKRKFKISSESDYNEGDNITFRAELYNENLEFVDDADIAMVISDEQGLKYDFSFSQNTGRYILNAGRLPIGNYTYKASTSVGQKKLSFKGAFSVSPVLLESKRSNADHKLLFQLANDNGGKMFYPNEVANLSQELQSKENITAISHSSTTWTDLINLKALLFLILFLLSLEWLLRKRQGSY